VIEVPYDLVSFGIGSDAAGAAAAAAGAPGVVASCKPIGRAVELQRRLSAWAAGSLALADRATGEARAARQLVVVGGGAAGFELALAAARRLAGATGAHRPVTLLEAGPDLLPGAPLRLRRRAAATLAHRGVEVRTGAAVEMVLSEGIGAGTRGPGGTGREAVQGGVAAGDPRLGIDPANEHPGAARLVLRGGEEMPCDLAIWATAAVGWPIFRDSGLPLDRRGFLLTDDSLRSIADPRVFAAGDCGTLARFPGTPKAGVYAVREGPILHACLRAALEGRNPPRYRPQRGFLSILNTCDGRALLSYKGLVSHSRWAWRLKDVIDRRFLARYA
jgi:NADH dehydrogenase FAD-containing subunit